MDTNENAKKSIILDAAYRFPKIFSNRQLDPKGKDIITCLKNGKKRVSEDRINKAFDILIKVNEKYGNLLSSHPNKYYIPVANTHEKELNSCNDAPVITQDSIVNEMQNKIKHLEEKIDLLTKEKESSPVITQSLCNDVTQKINGFSIMQKKTVSGKKTYLKWYGLRYINKKQVWVYVGSDPSKASEKIIAWEAKQVMAVNG